MTSPGPKGPGKTRQRKKEDRREREKRVRLRRAISLATRVLREKDATPESVRARLNGIKTRYRLSSIRLLAGQSDHYRIEATINPSGNTPSVKLKSKEFELDPRPFDKVEGFTLTHRQSGRKTTIHLLENHGHERTEEQLKQRLQDTRQKFIFERDQAITHRWQLIRTMRAKIATFRKQGAKQSRIANMQNEIQTHLGKIREFRNVNPKDRIAVRKYLQKWTGGHPVMAATKFHDRETMFDVIRKVLRRKGTRRKIDAILKDRQGRPFKRGTTKTLERLKHNRRRPIGMGYKFTKNMSIVKYRIPLDRIRIGLVVSSARKMRYMVHTAFLESQHDD